MSSAAAHAAASKSFIVLLVGRQRITADQPVASCVSYARRRFGTWAIS